MARLTRKKKLLFASVVPALLLGGELVARAFGFPAGFIRSTKALWAADAERALGPFRPGVETTLAWPPELAYTVRTNALGFRGPAPEPGKPLVLCLGDSTTFGMHVAEADTYPALLPEALRAKGVDAAVLNAGCPRWTITDEREQLGAALPALKPRAVVLLFCGNDLRELEKPPARERALEGRRGPGLLERLALPEALLVAGLNASRAWKRARGRWPEPLRADQGATAEHDRALWQRWGAELAHARAQCAEAGARLIVAAFPAYLEVETSEACHVEALLPPLVRQAGAEYLDLYPAFRAAHRERPRAAFLLPHDAHASPEGNALIARAVADALARGW